MSSENLLKETQPVMSSNININQVYAVFVETFENRKRLIEILVEKISPVLFDETDYEFRERT